jgi:hypothetical protein
MPESAQTIWVLGDNRFRHKQSVCPCPSNLLDLMRGEDVSGWMVHPAFHWNMSQETLKSFAPFLGSVLTFCAVAAHGWSQGARPSKPDMFKLVWVVGSRNQIQRRLRKLVRDGNAAKVGIAVKADERDRGILESTAQVVRSRIRTVG